MPVDKRPREDDQQHLDSEIASIILRAKRLIGKQRRSIERWKGSREDLFLDNAAAKRQGHRAIEKEITHELTSSIILQPSFYQQWEQVCDDADRIVEQSEALCCCCTEGKENVPPQQQQKIGSSRIVCDLEDIVHRIELLHHDGEVQQALPIVLSHLANCIR